MSRIHPVLLLVGVTAALTVGRPLHAAPRPTGDPPAAFVLVIGVNEPPTADLPRLRYADDDAARYFDLFRALGAKTYLHATLDDNTRRLHAQAAAEARPARARDIALAIASIGKDVAQARRRGLATAFYVIYAGHGDVARDGTAFLGLEGGQLTGDELLADIVTPVGADATHVIIDACYSSLLITGRGAGGSVRPVRGFVPRIGKHAPRVGFLLSTSSGREAHEWEGVQAGVFSHEVRSGLYGAADVDADGQVSYQEIAAFVARANEGIPNERFRPDVYARPPEGAAALLDLRKAPGGRVEVDGAHAGHWYLEDQDGVRLAEWHHAASADVSLIRPIGRGRLYLVLAGAGSERAIALGEGTVRVQDLVAEPARVAARGALDDAFDRVFALPFDAGAVAGYEFPPAPVGGERVWRRWQRPAGQGTLAVGITLAAGTVWLAVLAERDADAARDAPSQAERAHHNERLRRHRGAAYVVGASSAVAISVGAALLLWPDAPPGRGLELTPGGAFASWSWAF